MLQAVRLSVLALGLTATALLGGCNTITSADIRDDPTPELYSQTQTYEQFRNDLVIHRHHAWRTIHDDLARMFFVDKNTRMTPYPVP